MDVFNLQASIGLNVKNYMDGIKNAISAGQKLKQSVENQAASIVKNQVAIDTLKNKLEVAKTATSSASDNVAKLTDAFNKSVKETGAASDETKDLAEQLNKAERELKQCQNAEESLNKELKNLSENADDAKDENKELGNEIKKAGDKSVESSGKFEKFGDALKGVASTAGKVVSAIAKISTAAVGAATAGLTALTKKALDASASYEQLKGGVETLFGAGGMTVQEYAESVGKSVDEVQGHYAKLMTAQQKVMDNSYKAFQTAGMSSNEYMETVTSFSASLLQSVGGDANIAADIADRAIRDMSDNANKMGTNIQSIQNAYQGFAKQNYTMLDNLKLGYGGTKEEMERLITDASKMTDIQKSLNISVKNGDMSFANIANAISVMQKNMGIAGTTSKEAAGTIEGSVGSMKAAWENLLTAFGSTDMPIDTFAKNFVDSLSGAASNVVPRIGQIVQSIGMVFPDLVGNLFDSLKSTIEETDLGNTLLDGVDTLVTNAAQVLESMIGSIFDGDNLTNLIERAAGTVGTIGESIWNILKLGMEVIPEKLPEIIDILSGMITGAVDTLTEDLPTITKSVTNIIGQLVDGWTDLAKSGAGVKIAESALDLVVALGESIVENYPKLIEATMEILPKAVEGILSRIYDVINIGAKFVEKFIEGITSDDGSLLDTAVEVVMKLVDAVTENIDDILIAAETLIMALVDGLTKPETLEKILEAGTTVFIKIVEGLASATGSLLGFTDQFTNDVATWLLEYDWAGLGLAIVNGIADGILQIEGVQEAVDGFAEVWADGYIAIEEFVANVKAKWDEFWTNMEELWFKVHDGIENFKTNWADFWANVVETLQTKVEEFKGKIEAIPMKFAELVDKARSWGTDMIQNFIDGITSKFSALIQKVQSVAQTVADYLHFSVPEKGPLSDFDKSAPDMIDLFTQGIEQNAYKISNAFDKSLDIGSIDGDIQTAQIATQQDASGNRTQNAPAYGWDELMQKLDVIVSAIREGKIIKVESIDNALGSLQDLTERVDFA